MKNFRKNGIPFLVFLYIILPMFSPIFVDGQATIPPTKQNSSAEINIPNPLKNGVNDFVALVAMILNKIIMPIAAIGVVIFIIYAGFTYVIAQGNATKIAEAHQRLLWGLVGGGIILGAAGISKVVETTFKELVN
jgi:hypothetical protein